jgi:glutaredoxin
MSRLAVLVSFFALALACGDDDAESIEEGAGEEARELDLEGTPADPPFGVSGDLDGLMLVWFDEEGPHTATQREDVPEDRRQYVRVDSLRLAPDERLDADHVWVADVRAERNGEYPVRTLERATFDALVDRAAGTTPPSEVADPGEPTAVAQAGDPNADVIIYGADWCGACRSAASYLRQREVPFVEKNIERDEAALAEMQAKARRAGINPSGIPVIDFRGTMLTGFDPQRLDQLIRGT